MRRVLLAALVAALAVPAAAAAYTPSDPLVKYQWYLAQDHAFDWFPDTLPALNAVRVAVIDSGLDGTNPEFPKDRIFAKRSFIGGSFDFGSLIGFVDEDQPILGAIHHASGVRVDRVPVLPHRLREAILAREKAR